MVPGAPAVLTVGEKDGLTRGTPRPTERAVGLHQKEGGVERKASRRRKMREMRNEVRVSGRSGRKRGLLSVRA